MSMFQFKPSKDGYAAYVRCPGHPGERARVARTVSLADLMGRYDGPHIVFDFDAEGRMLGVEFVAPDPADDEDDGTA